jgi:hypothetical protein
MLQIDHIYEFLYQELFKDFDLWYCKNGVVNTNQVSCEDIKVFTQGLKTTKKIFFYDQEPFIDEISKQYMDIFNWQSRYSIEKIIDLAKTDRMPHGSVPPGGIEILCEDYDRIHKKAVLATSEYSSIVNSYVNDNFKILYYFFHGFAALDWYRGYHALNYNKTVVKPYKYDFISFNRIINHDRSYRIYFVSKLVELGLLKHGQVSFNVTDSLFDDWRDEVADPNTKLSETARQHAERYLTNIDKLVIDNPSLPGSASADIPRTISAWFPQNDQPKTDAFWHVVTETVFYYDKLHLTEKIFKPIVSKQPFMLLAAPGNLTYLKNYGFKTFDSVLDESYDLIKDNDLRIEAVVKQLQWYCGLSEQEKIDVMQVIEPIVLHNFHHFYGEFRHIITRELLNNTKTLFQSIGYDDSHINYDNIHHILTR